MTRYEEVRLVTPADPDYRSWRDWNIAADKERRDLAKKAQGAARVPKKATASPSSIIVSQPRVAALKSEAQLTPAGATSIFAPSAPDVPLTRTPSEAPSVQAHHEAERRQFGYDAEYLLRTHLRSSLPVWNRRVLRYSFRKENGRWTTRYRELDVVALDGRRLYIFEIKATRRAEKVKRGIAQLAFVREVLAESFLDVITSLIVVDTDAIGGEAQTPVSKYLQNATALVPVARLADLTSTSAIQALVLTTNDVEAIAQRRLNLSWNTAA